MMHSILVFDSLDNPHTSNAGSLQLSLDLYLYNYTSARDTLTQSLTYLLRNSNPNDSILLIARDVALELREAD